MSRVQALIAQYPLATKIAKLPKTALMGLGAGLVALLVVATLWMGHTNYKVLFSNLQDKDGGKIIAALSQMNVPYTMSENGAAILVPGDKVHSLRLQLAEQGLPEGGNVGFDLMSESKFGASQFAEQVSYQRAIEGELARSIEAMHSIQSARIHLAIPKETLFVRESKQPTASVLLTMHPGRALADGQVAAISWLIASSVPDLTVQNVSIVDQTGRLLTTGQDSTAFGASTTKLKFTSQIEDRTRQRVLSILTPVLGPGNVHTEVSAEVDFDQREQTSETFRPNQKPELAAVRSEQINSTAQRGVTPAMGIPGTLSNEPPTPTQAPIVLPEQDDEELNATNLGPSSETSNSTINYEVDRTINHTKESVGRLKRLSVAVVVNHRPDSEGVLQPLDDEELERIRGLVTQAIGYSEERGDTLDIANAPFSVEPTLPLWQDPALVDLAKTVVKYLALALLILFLWWRVVSPVLRSQLAALEPKQDKQGESSDQGSDQTQLDASSAAIEKEGKAAGKRYEESVNNARSIAGDDPRVAAMILRTWMKQDEDDA